MNYLWFAKDNKFKIQNSKLSDKKSTSSPNSQHRVKGANFSF